MTMHLVRGMSTLSTRKRKQNRKPGHAASMAAHDAWLRKNGVHPDQLKTKEKNNGASIPDYSEKSSTIKTSDRVMRIQGKRKANEYSGEYVVGLATLHKSNIVPVGRGQDPEELAKMRR